VTSTVPTEKQPATPNVQLIQWPLNPVTCLAVPSTVTPVIGSSASVLTGRGKLVINWKPRDIRRREDNTEMDLREIDSEDMK
jgi:hypothetical protein